MPKALLKQAAQHSARQPQREIVSKSKVTRRVTPDFRDCVGEIRRLWGDTLDRNLEVAQIITQFQGTVSKAKFDDYGLPFGYSWFRRLLKIGRHGPINDETNRGSLPDARRTLHQISLLSDKQFKAAKAEGFIHRDVTATEVEQWRKRKAGRPDQIFKYTITERRPSFTDPGEKTPEPDEDRFNELTAAYREALWKIGYRFKGQKLPS